VNSASAELGHSSDELRDEVDADRFELVRDGHVVAWMKYKHLKPSRYVLLHTEVDQAQRGTVTAICPFVADYLAGAEQYKDLIDPRHPGYPNRAAAERGDGATTAGAE